MIVFHLVRDLPADLVPILVGRSEVYAFVQVTGLSTSSRRRPGGRDEVPSVADVVSAHLWVCDGPEVTCESRRPTSSRDTTSDSQGNVKTAGRKLADLVPILVATSSRPDDPSRDEVKHPPTSTSLDHYDLVPPRPGRPRDDVSDLVPSLVPL